MLKMSTVSFRLNDDEKKILDNAISFLASFQDEIEIYDENLARKAEEAGDFLERLRYFDMEYDLTS